MPHAKTLLCVIVLALGSLPSCTSKGDSTPGPGESPETAATPAPSDSPASIPETPEGSSSRVQATSSAGSTDPAAAIDQTKPSVEDEMNEEKTGGLATLGAGCFWCIEAVLEQLEGVERVESGYMGGHVADPTYRQVCSETTGHAEVVQVHFDPDVMSYEKLLDFFWRLHDPTTLNQQGADRGTQYRSAIFYHDEKQRESAEASKKAAAQYFADPIVTEITRASIFYKADASHQNFYFLNQTNGYCRAVILPKLEKLGLKH